MGAVFKSESGTWDYTAGASAVAVGQVVIMGKVIGIACRPIPANTLGAVATRGVFTMDKAAGGNLTRGQVAYLHSNLNVTGSVTTTGIAGIVVADAATGATTVDVDINAAGYDVNSTGPA